MCSFTHRSHPPHQLTKVLGCIGTIRTFDRQVAEIKRAVFRALTRLRAATIKATAHLHEHS